MNNPAVVKAAILPPDTPPLLVVVIDTEEEFDWAARFDRKNRSVDCIPEQLWAHQVFAHHHITPTYVIDHPVAATVSSAAFFRSLIAGNECHIGAHLHPWVNPPDMEEVNEYNSYPGNLPASLELQKLEILTKCIEKNIGVRPVIYKAGRYGYGPHTTEILEKLGYEIDASVVPYTDLRDEEGPNFKGLPDQPYWFGSYGNLFEVPLTKGFAGMLGKYGGAIYPVIANKFGLSLHLPGIFSRLGLLERIGLTPEGITLDEQIRLTKALVARGKRIFSYTYHSSSLLPGGSPYVATEADRKQFLQKMDDYFSFFINEIGGRPSTLVEVRDLCCQIKG